MSFDQDIVLLKRFVFRNQASLTLQIQTRHLRCLPSGHF